MWERAQQKALGTWSESKNKGYSKVPAKQSAYNPLTSMQLKPAE